jgi:hypothetical protein
VTSARRWIVAGVVLTSTGAMLFAVQAGGASPARTLLVAWFLVVCPGAALVGILGLEDAWLAAATAIALSLALDAIVAATLTYSGLWSPRTGLVALAVVAAGGASAQIALDRPRAGR